MPVSRTYYNGVWSANPTPAPAVPAPTTPTPTPAVPPHMEKLALENKMREYWKSRSGAELFKIFKQIQAENPMAARAFWDSAMGTGAGMNDLVQQTIQNEFGGDMNRYNNWRNLYHNQQMDSMSGYFDLATGTWTPSQGHNQDYIRERTGQSGIVPEWNIANTAWKYSGDWSKFLNDGLGGQVYDPVKSKQFWEGVGTPEFSNYGVTYVPNGPNSSVKPNPVATRGPGQPLPNPAVPGYTPAAVGPGVQGTPPVTTPPPAPNVAVPTPTSTPDPTPVNPYGSSKPSTKGYQFPIGRWGRH